MRQVKPMPLKRRLRRYGSDSVSAEVFPHPNAITGGVLVVTDSLGVRYYEDTSICGIDQCLAVARQYGNDKGQAA